MVVLENRELELYDYEGLGYEMGARLKEISSWEGTPNSASGRWGANGVVCAREQAQELVV